MVVVVVVVSLVCASRSAFDDLPCRAMPCHAAAHLMGVRAAADATDYKCVLT